MFCSRCLPHTYLSHILLHQLGADDSDEARVGPIGHGTSTQGLSCAGRPEQEHTFWRFDTQIDKSFGLGTRGQKHDALLLTSLKTRTSNWTDLKLGKCSDEEKLWQSFNEGIFFSCEHSHAAGGSRPLPSAFQSAPCIHQHHCRSHQASPRPTIWEHSFADCSVNCRSQAVHILVEKGILGILL